jgi:Glycosyl hydrolases related to GH101 family, GH129/Carbohydrate family 9 binding domain-like
MKLAAILPIALSAAPLAAADISSTPARWRLENANLRVTLQADTGNLTVLDKRSGYTWRQAEAIRCTETIAVRQAPRRGAGGAGLGDGCSSVPAIRLTPKMVADAKRVDGPADLSAELRLTWDTEALYLAATVRDEKRLFATKTDREWWQRDSVEFWVNAQQFGVALDPAAPALLPMGRPSDQPADGALAVSPTSDGYVLLGAFPWATLGLKASDVQPGRTFRFAFGVNDADGTGAREGQLYFPATWVHSNPATFAIAQFTDAQGQAPAPPAPQPVVRNVEETKDGLRYATASTSGNPEVMVQTALSLLPDASDLVIETDLPDRTQPAPSTGPLQPFVITSAKAFIGAARYCDGLLFDCDDMRWRGTRMHTGGDLDMPWVLVTDLVQGYLILADTPDDAVISLEAVDMAGKPRLSPALTWDNSKGQFRYPRRVIVSFTDRGGYVALCKRYREHAKQLGYLATQREKEKRLPEVALLAGAPDVWGAWGLDFCRQAKAAGIDRMLVNWRGSKADMEEVKRLGYLVGEYDNYVDIQDGPLGSGPTKAPIPAAAIKNADGSPSIGWVTWDKKTTYMQLCAALAKRDAELLIPPLLERAPFNARFLDVTTAMGLRECYDVEHPLTRTEWRQANEALADYVTGLGLVLGGEHGRWYGAKMYNYWEGMQSGGFYSWPAGHVGVNIPQKREEIGEDYLKYGIGHYYRVPLYELCFHDCVTSTWYWGDSTGHLYTAAPEIADKQDAFNVLYGTIPLYWVSQPYSFNWRDPKLRERLLQSYRNTCKLHEQVFYDEMLSHEFVTDDHAVQRTRFASGIEATVNFGEQPYAVSQRGKVYVLPQNGFVAEGGNFLAYLALEGDRKVNFIAAPRYVFCDPGGTRYDFGVVETNVPTTLRATGPGELSLIVAGAAEPTAVTLRPGRLDRDWRSGRARLYALAGDGSREEQVAVERRGDDVTCAVPPGTYSLLYGPAANKPDLVLVDGSVAVATSPQGATIVVQVTNAGTKACRALVAATVTTTRGPVELGRAVVPVAPGQTQAAKVAFSTAGLDGPWPVTVTVRPEPDEEEFLSNNNRAVAPAVFPAAYDRWQHRADLAVAVDAPDRQDEPATLATDLTKLFGVPVDRLDLASLRVVEIDATGKLTEPVPAQFDGRDGTGELALTLAGRTPAGAVRHFAALCDEPGAKTPYTPAGTMVWNAADASVTTPVYRVTLSDGVISSCTSLTGSRPTESFLRSLGCSSQETGWVDEVGELQSLDLVAWGPVRIVLRASKKLQGGYDYTKTYAFYRGYFTVTTDANKPIALYSRAYYLLPARFEDDKGNSALVDGQGDEESVSGRNPSPKWYAMVADGWAHSCVALTPFSSLTYWDAGAWGGIGFGTGETKAVKLAYVIHGAEKDAGFAAQDYDRLTHPPTARVTR